MNSPNWLPLVTLPLLVVGVYLPLWLRVEGFCFDDRAVMLEFAPWQDRGWRAFTRDHLGSFTSRWMSSRGAWWLVCRLLFPFCGLRRRAWLTVGIGWHIINTLLLYALARELGATVGHAYGVSALFAVHPMAVPTVALVGGSPSALVLTGILSGCWLVLHGLTGSALVVGLATTGIKLDGWAYWPHVALVAWVCR